VARAGRLPAGGRPGPGDPPLSSLLGVLAITLILFFVVALTGRLILGR
jgi:hypothetical protein